MSKTVSRKNVKKDAGDMAPGKDSAVYKNPDDKPIEQEAGAASNAPLSDRAQAALKAMARIAAPHKDELKHEHIAHAMKAAGCMGGEDMAKDDVEMGVAYPEKVEDEHHMSALGEANKAYKSHLEKLGYRKYPDAEEAAKAKDHMEEDDEDEVEKTSVGKNDKQGESVKDTKTNAELSGFNEAQKSQLEGVFKAHNDRIKELVAKNDGLAKQLKDRETAEKTREFIAKADTFKHLGLEREEIVETLRDASDLGEKAYTRIVKQFEAMNEQARAGGLFKEVGTSRGGEANSAEARIDAAIDSVVKKSDGKTTREEAYSQFMETAEGRKLYADYKNGRRGGA